MMKYTTTHLTLSLILLISISISISGATGESSSSVVDTDGNEVKEGVEYTLIAKTWTLGIDLGGISQDSTCPPNVVQDAWESVGLPVVFYSLTDEDGVIRTSSYLIIDFADPTTCEDTSATSWKVEYNALQHISEVKVRGAKVRPSNFKLEKVSASEYKLANCASPTICQDLLIHGDDLIHSPRKRLIASNGGVPFTVTITRAKSKNNLMIRKQPALFNPTT